MKLESYTKDDVIIIRPETARIDASIAPSFKTGLAEFLENGKIKLIIDLSKVEFIDSSGLGVLVLAYRRAGNEGAVKLCRVNDGVRSIFELTRLDKVFEIYRSEKDALDSFKR